MKSKAIGAVCLMAVVAAGIVLAFTYGRDGPKPPERAGVPAQAGPRATDSAPASPETASPAEAGSAAPRDVASGQGLAAMERAAAAGKYLFFFFHKGGDSETGRLRSVFEAAMQKTADRAQSLPINVGDAAERPIVDRFGVDRAPLPLVLVLAPNGAVTGGFPGNFEEETLLAAFASPAMEKCLKALQDRKLVVLCAQNASTGSNDAAGKAAQEFKADARFAGFTEVVHVDPADAAEGRFMAQLRIEPKTAETVTVLLAPPGSVLGSFSGAVGKDALVAALMAAHSGGCGPSGCGPAGCQ